MDRAWRDTRDSWFTGRPNDSFVRANRGLVSRVPRRPSSIAPVVPHAGICRHVLRNGKRRIPRPCADVVPRSAHRGSIVMLSSGVLGVWALVSFRSWRVLAKIERGHQLATQGPFRTLRHPIYMAMNLLALGTALWVPTIIVWAAFVLMTIGSDIRARAEETLLERAFGASYRQYRLRTWRFVPGVY